MSRSGSRDAKNEGAELGLVATCPSGVEPLLVQELSALGMGKARPGTGAVRFAGSWNDCWRANLWLRTANRVLVELGSWRAADGDAIYRGARRLVESGGPWSGVSRRELFDPQRTLSIRATSRRSEVRDVRWVALRTKDGLVDAQRDGFGRRASVDRKRPQLPLRAWLFEDRMTLLLDTSREPLDRRGYRLQRVEAPLREHLAAACVLAADWDGRGPVVDPMCGSGTLLAEAGWYQAGIAPSSLRRRWVFEGWSWLDRGAWRRLRTRLGPTRRVEDPLIGYDVDASAVSAARQNLEAAGLGERAIVTRTDGLAAAPPDRPGLLVVNPPYGERMERDPQMWRALGDCLKQRYGGWRAVVLAGDPDRGKFIGLRPHRKLSVRNGPLEARILVFDLY